VYRIGELSQLANVSKRTIDYYTNLGLLTAQRSDSNYRYYDQTALDVLQLIGKYKQVHMPLGEIKRLIEENRFVPEDQLSVLEQVGEITKHIHELENEIIHVQSLLENSDEVQRIELRKHLAGQASTLMQTLLTVLM
jgi:DNA-binding transcriptional MerR regulator